MAKNPNEIKEKMRSLLPHALWAVILIAFAIIFYQYVKNVHFTGIPGLLNILKPVTIGLIITFFMAPLVSKLEQAFFRLQNWLRTTPRKVPVSKRYRASTRQNAGLIRLFAMLIGYVVVFGLLILMIVYIIPQVVNSLSTIVTMLGESITQLVERLQGLSDHWDNTPLSKYVDMDALADIVNSQLNTLTTALQRYLTNLVPQIYTFVIQIANSVIKVVIGLIMSIYLVADRERMLGGVKKIIYSLFSKKNAMLILNAGTETSQIFKFFFLGKLIDSLLIGILCYILMLILRLDYPLLIAVIVGITNIIPSFGPFIGAIPSAFILFMSSPMQALIFIIMIVCLQQFDGNILGPYILGGSLGIKPFWIIFSVTIGGAMFGLPGMLFGVPFFVVIYTLIHRYIDYRLRRKDLDPDNVEELELERQGFSHPIVASVPPAKESDGILKRLKKLFQKKQS